MKIGPRTVLVLHENEELRYRLHRLCGREFVVSPARDWWELAEMARSAPPSAVAVLDPYDGRGAPLSHEFRTLLAEFPSLPVFPAITSCERYAARIVELCGAGVADIVTIARDDSTRAMRERFRQANGRSLKLLLQRVLPDGLGGRAVSILEVAADVVASGGYGGDVAQTLAMSPRTLLRWTARSELPSPRRLLAWLRVLQAAELLDDPGRTIQSVARACGYSAETGLRRVIQNFVGESPTTLRCSGAFDLASTAFAHELECARHQA